MVLVNLKNAYLLQYQKSHLTLHNCWLISVLKQMQSIPSKFILDDRIKIFALISRQNNVKQFLEVLRNGGNLMWYENRYRLIFPLSCSV